MKIVKSVLLVEDSKDDQFFFCEALNEIDTAVVYDIAYDGKMALDKLERAAILPDMIFMDIHMPVMNGIECLAELSKNEKIKNIPVVILSTDTRHLEVVRQLGARAFISKTSDFKTLRQKLDQIINLDFINDSHIADRTFLPGYFQ